MNRILLALTILFSPAALLAQGYTGQQEVQELGNGVYPSDSRDGAYIENVGAFLASVPQDDWSKPHISILTMNGCGACDQLKRCLASDPEWLALTQSGMFHFHEYNASTRTGSAHINRILGGRRVSYPTILVQDANGTVICQESGYNGNCRGLIRGVIGRIVQFVRKVTPPYPNIFPRPRPVQTYPDTAPQPQPSPQPLVNPLVPVNPILKWPPDDAVTPTTGIPDYPQIVILTDPTGIVGKIKMKAVETAAQRLASEHGIEADVRSLLWEEHGQSYGVPHEAVPAVVYTSHGHVLAIVPMNLIAMLKEEVKVADPELLREASGLRSSLDELKSKFTGLQSERDSLASENQETKKLLDVVRDEGVQAAGWSLYKGIAGGASPFVIGMLALALLRAVRKSRGKEPLLDVGIVAKAEDFVNSLKSHKDEALTKVREADDAAKAIVEGLTGKKDGE